MSDSGGFFMHEAFIFFAIVPLAILIMAILIGSLVWAYQDAEKREKSGWLVVFVILFFKLPFFFLILVAFIPDIKKG